MRWLGRRAPGETILFPSLSFFSHFFPFFSITLSWDDQKIPWIPLFWFVVKPFFQGFFFSSFPSLFPIRYPFLPVCARLYSTFTSLGLFSLFSLSVSLHFNPFQVTDYIYFLVFWCLFSALFSFSFYFIPPPFKLLSGFFIHFALVLGFFLYPSFLVLFSSFREWMEREGKGWEDGPVYIYITYYIVSI